MRLPFYFRFGYTSLNILCAITCFIRSVWKRANDLKTDFIIKFFEKDCSVLIKKYKYYDKNQSTIGNRVWMFWNTGFDNAPPVVKRCAERAKKINNIDLVLLDFQNIYEYVEIDHILKDKYEKGTISIQLYSDIIRNSLLNKYGGFWIDATGFILDDNYINNHMNLSFYTAKHDSQKTLHFVKGLWSVFMIGSGKENPMIAFASDFYVWYFSKYNKDFTYFFTDYIYLIAYRNISAVKKQVDNVVLENENIFALWQNFYKPYSEKVWEDIKTNNIFQKMVWRVKPKKCSQNCFYEYFVNKKGCKLP